MTQILLSPLLVVGICLAVAVCQKTSPFDFRACNLKHISNTYVATCNGSSKIIKEKNIFLDGRITQHVSEIDLTSFESVIFDSTVRIGQISISQTKRVSLFLSNPSLTDLKIDSVEELTIMFKNSKYVTEDMNSMSLNNINTLSLISDVEFTWRIKSVKLTKVGDIDLRSLLSIFAKSLTISESYIYLRHKTPLILSASSASIDKSFLYIYKNGSLKVTADNFFVTDTTVNMDDGNINVINSKEVVIANSSLYSFDHSSLTVQSEFIVMFEKNNIFTSDIVGVLNLREKNVIMKQNHFGCTICSVKSSLLAVDIQDVGDVNYCYSHCNLTLNLYKKLLSKSCICTEGDSEVSFERLCVNYGTDMACVEPVTSIDLLRWFLLISIPTVLIISLLLCICHKDNRKKLKAAALKNIISQEIPFEQRDEHAIMFSNLCYDNVQNSEHIYEAVEPITCT